MIREALFTSIMQGTPVTEDFTLFGWSRRSALGLEIEGEEPSRVTHSLVAVRLALPAAEGLVRIPKGVCHIDVAPPHLVGLYQRGSWKARSQRGGELEACFAVPTEWRNVRPRRIRVFYKCRVSGNLRAALSAYDWAAQQWVALKPAARTELTDPERFYLRPDGHVKLRVSVTELRRAHEDQAERMNRWQIEDLDIEIEGEAARD